MADDDDALLAGVPDDVVADDDAMVMEEAAEEAADEAAAEERERAAARARQRAAEEDEEAREAARERQRAAEEEDEAEMQDGTDASGGTSMPKRSGKRKIIHHALDPSLLHGGVGGGAIVADDEELERRRARAAKFETAVPEPAAPPQPQIPSQMLTMEEVARREERAKKWGVEASEKDPLASIATLAGDKGYWEKRRDASAFEQPRPEAIHIFGTDRLSTEDLLLYFIDPGVTREEQAPQWVEWVNDSSANVVFRTAEATAEAAAMRTVPLLPNAQGIDTQAWRTMPETLLDKGKGLQLLFRIATTKDVKPAKRATSRWYGEIDSKARKGKMGGAADRRDQRRQGTTPYGRGPAKGGREESRARAIAAQGFEEGKASLAEQIAKRTALQDGRPSLAETIQMKSGPTLADMAAAHNSGVSGLTLADMAGLANSGGAGPSAARKVEIQPASHGGDLRSRLGAGGRKKPADPEAERSASKAMEEAAALADAAEEAAPGGLFSYEAAKVEMDKALAGQEMEEQQEDL